MIISDDNQLLLLNRQAGPYSHDIALLKLAVKGDGCGVRFSPLVSPVCLPRPHTQFSPNSVCHVAGWGKTKCKSQLQQDPVRY